MTLAAAIAGGTLVIRLLGFAIRLTQRSLAKVLRMPVTRVIEIPPGQR